MKTRTILKHSNLVFALLATFWLLLGNAITVSAAESPKNVTEIGIGIDDSKIQPRYIVSCSHTPSGAFVVCNLIVARMGIDHGFKRLAGDDRHLPAVRC